MTFYKIWPFNSNLIPQELICNCCGRKLTGTDKGIQFIHHALVLCVGCWMIIGQSLLGDHHG